jgi:hypothetical protein
MPRVRVRPWTMYEEAVGLKKARVFARIAAGVTFFNITVGFILAGKFGKSRHVDDTKEQNAEYEKRIRGNLDYIAGAGERFIHERQSRYRTRLPSEGIGRGTEFIENLNSSFRT